MLHTAEVLTVAAEALTRCLPEMPHLAANALEHIMLQMASQQHSSQQAAGSSFQPGQQEAHPEGDMQMDESYGRAADHGDESAREAADVHQGMLINTEATSSRDTAYEVASQQLAAGLAVSAEGDRAQMAEVMSHQVLRHHAKVAGVALSQACAGWAACEWTECVYEVPCSAGDGGRHRMFVRSANRQLRIATGIASHASLGCPL